MRNTVDDIFNSFEECKQHIIDHMEDTHSREKIIKLAEWLYSLEGVNCYPVNEPGIRFCKKDPSYDHFLCVKYRKKSAEIHLLNCFSSTGIKQVKLFGKNKIDEFADVHIPIPKWQDYMSLQKDNTRWVRINGRSVTKLLTSEFETIQQNAQDSYDYITGSRMQILEAGFIEKMSGLTENAISICDFYRQTDFPWCALGKIVKIKSNIGQVTEIANDGSKFVIRNLLTGKQQTFIVYYIKNLCDEC